MATIRITRGVGSSPKAWAILRERGRADQVGEFDLSDDPGWFDEDANGINGMSGIIWAPDGTVGERLLYDSMEDWVSDITDIYPDADIVVDLSSGPDWP